MGGRLAMHFLFEAQWAVWHCLTPGRCARFDGHLMSLFFCAILTPPATCRAATSYSSCSYSVQGPSSAASSTAPSAAPPTTPSTVEELFHMNGLSMPTPAWDNIFKTKPKKRLVDFDDKAALCQCLAHLHIWFKKQLDEDSGDAETVGKQSEEPPAEGECPDENQAEDQKSDSSKDSRSMRLCLFYLASFPGSGKTHLCRQLAEVLDKLRSDDKRTSDELLGAAQRGAALPRPAMCA